MQFTMKADITQAMLLFHALQGPEMMMAVATGVGKAAHRVEETMRKELWSMIYSVPEGDYERTGRLLQGAHAAQPGTDHSGDDDIAVGMDMHIDEPTMVVGIKGLEFASEIGDWVSYAWFVHEGKGLGNRPARPFSNQANMDAPFFLAQEVNSAVAGALLALIR